jgi:quinol-cytochrome oxidoreductase complex cytochrome b subunit/mono/diheme cytochrome c family protein
MQRLRDWLDHRVGYRRFVEVMLLEHIPGGARWRYVWGSTLAFVFLIQLVTGVLLMTSYSPGASTAWSSVYFIQYEMDFGWFIRGLHHFGSQTMVVLLGVHMLQVVIAGAQLPPRELNWWLGLGLLGVVLGLSLTGYLLPWDQKGFWATQVATNIAGNIPGIGEFLQRVVVGGPAYGHHTLTRFYTLHVGILPPLLIVLTILHLVTFRRHGVTVDRGVTGEGMFWPEQAFRDLLVCLVIFGVMIFLVINGHGHPVEAAPKTAGASEKAAEQGGWLGETYEHWAHAGREGRGANLDAPADPSRPYPARPEWYFLFLFELLKFFEGEQELIGTVVIPNGVAVLLFLLPLLGYGWMRPFGRVFGVLVIVDLLGSVAGLTFLALADDALDPTAAAVLRRIGLWVVPAIAGFFLLYLALLAVLRHGSFRRLVYGLGVLVLALALGGTGYLAYAALRGDVPAPVTEAIKGTLKPNEDKTPESVQTFHKELKQAERDAERALILAGRGIAPEGPVGLLRRDPRGIFLKSCAACHSFGEFGPADFKTREQEGFAAVSFKASDLAGFGTEDWIYHFLLDPKAERFLGRARRADGKPFTRMADWVAKERKKARAKGTEAELEADFRALAAWLATSPRGKPSEKSPHAATYELFTGKYNCVRCHTFAQDEGENNVPMLTGYGSTDWLRLLLRSPGHPRLYGVNNNMPAFRDLEGLAGEAEKQEYLNSLKTSFPDLDVAKVRFANLSSDDRDILIRYLAEEHRRLYRGPVAAAAKE